MKRKRLGARGRVNNIPLHSVMRAGLLLSIVAITLLTQLPASGQGGYAKGIAIYKLPLDTEATARALLYRKTSVNGPFNVFDTGAPELTWIERGTIVTMIEFGHLLMGDVVSEGGRQELATMYQSLSDWSKRCPRAAPVIKGVLDVLSSAITKYDGGEVRVGGVWQNKKEYDANMKEVAKSLEEQQARRKVKLDHFKGEYPSRAARPLLDFYSDNLGEIAALIANSKGFAELDAGLRTRSQLIPEPREGTEAGVYSSDAGYGPTVIWVAQGGKIVALLVSFCLDPRKLEAIEKQTELELTRNFLARFDSRIYDWLPDALAAAAIRAVQQRKHFQAVGGPLECGKFTVEMHAHSTGLTADGTGSQPVILVLL
jgi:hypothetical protein